MYETENEHTLHRDTHFHGSNGIVAVHRPVLLDRQFEFDVAGVCDSDAYR